MTAIPLPAVSRIQEEEDAKLVVPDDAKLKRNLLKDFDTPLVVSKRISRLSQKFEKLPSDYAINVFLRLRPFTEKELQCGEDQKCWKISSDYHILTAMAPKESKALKSSTYGVRDSVEHFTFTNIFNESTSQNDFYEKVAQPLVKEFLAGDSGLIFTYGVTNSGKTYTLHGNPGNEGIIPQAIDNVFDEIGDKMLEDVSFGLKMGKNLYKLTSTEKNKHSDIKSQVLAMADETRLSGQKSIFIDSTSDCSQIDSCNTTQSSDSNTTTDHSDLPVKYAMFVSFVELYCESVYDLLAPVSEDKLKVAGPRPQLSIIDDKQSASHVKGMREIQVNSAQEVLKILSAGQKNLHVAATRLNKDSSRSHCVFTITLVQVMDVPKPRGARISKISFCDLAGSERPTKTGEVGDRLKEAGNINKSILVLKRCIENLRHNQKHKNAENKQRTVPYRESKLTRIFRSYLLGDGRACMIVNTNMCATGFDETLRVLEFSAIAREVQSIVKPRPSKRKSAPVEDNLLVKNKSTRTTIDWGRMSPIEDVDESAINEDNFENATESEESDDDSSACEESFEYDIEFWKNRERKYEEVVDMLKKENMRLREESRIRENEIRKQCYENTRQQIVEIQESHAESIEETIAIMTEEQLKKREIMIRAAKSDHQELKTRYEGTIWDLTAKNKAIETELKDCNEKLDEKASALSEAENKTVTLQIEINKLERESDEKSRELDALKRRSRRSSSRPDKEMEDLLEQIDEGKSLIQSLMEESDKKDTQIRDMQENIKGLEAGLTKSQDSSKAVEEELKRLQECEKDYVKAKDKLLMLESEISDIESKSGNIMTKLMSSSEDIIILEDGKYLKCTEGILPYLVDSIEKKNKELDSLKNVCSEMEIQKSSLETHSGTMRQRISDFKARFATCKRELNDFKLHSTNELDLMRKYMQETVKSISERIHMWKIGRDSQIEDLTSERDRLLMEAKNIEERMNSLSTDKEQELRLMLSEKETKIKEMNSNVLTAEAKVRILQDQNDILSSEKSRIEEELCKKADDAVKLAEDMEILNTNLIRVQKIANECDDVKKKEQTAITERNRLQDEVDTLKKQLQEETGKLCTANTMHERELKERVQETEKISRLQIEIKDKTTTLKEIRHEIQVNGKENLKLRKDLEQSGEKYRELQKSKDACDKRVAALLATLEDKNSAIQTLKQESKHLKQGKDEIEKDFINLEKEVETLKETQASIDKERNLSESERVDFRSAIKCKEAELENLQASYNKFKSEAEEYKMKQKNEFENAKNKFADELKEIKSDLKQSKKNIDAKQKELDGFRENRDRIVQALETQISNGKACNDKLMTELDTQMAKHVKLESEKAAALAEVLQLKKQLNEQKTLTKDISRHLRGKSVSETAVDVKIEPSSGSGADSGPLQSEPKAPDDCTKSARASTRSRRGTKRGSSILKRGKRNTRPATPLPEVTSDDNEIESPPKKPRVTESSIKNEGDGVLDDSELLKETGNARCFPEPVMEIDATPSTSRKGMRTRKHAEKRSDDSDPDFRSSSRKTTLRKTRAANSNNSNSNDVDDGAASPVLTSVTRNFSQVGSMIRNSPVGSAFKRFEEAISPASKSPKKPKKTVVEKQTKKGRRVKLHPDDISSPLEASPDVVVQDQMKPVSDTPGRMIRRLRSRK